MEPSIVDKNTTEETDPWRGVAVPAAGVKAQRIGVILERDAAPTGSPEIEKIARVAGDESAPPEV